MDITPIHQRKGNMIYRLGNNPAHDLPLWKIIAEVDDGYLAIPPNTTYATSSIIYIPKSSFGDNIQLSKLRGTKDGN